MDLHKISESETTQLTQIICNNQFTFDSAYFTYGSSSIAQTVNIKRYNHIQPSQTSSKNNLEINIVYPIIEIVY
jgi:hypothetical protein